MVEGERERQHLDGDLAFQLRVRRAKHLPHPTRANLGGDLVNADASAGIESQTVWIIQAEYLAGPD